jgi:hypothetical protein
MITKPDWQAVLDAITAEDRETLGPPPSAEEMLAFEKGALPAAEEERVRRLLVAYPELARALAHPFPSDDTDDELGEIEVQKRWNEFRARIDRAPSGGRVLLFWRTFGAVAAAVALTFGGLFWQARHDLVRPHLLGDEQVLQADGGRGADGGALTLNSDGDSVLLTVPIIGAGGYEQYRLEIFAPGSGAPSWRSGVLARPNSDSFPIVVPRGFLAEPGTYQVVLFGVRGGSEERLATYSVRVPGR